MDDRFDPAIRIIDYDPSWPTTAEAELRRIREQLGPLAVRAEHVGSTAEPGLAAKLIFDLQLSVPDTGQRSAYVEPLGTRVLVVPDPAATDYHFFAKPPQRPRRFHLHVCELGSKHEFRHLAVRD